MREDGLRVVARLDGKHEVQTVAGEVLAVCDSNAQAWRWIDRHSIGGQKDEDRQLRIRQSDRFS
ncbi:MAG: hypothetical protein DI498_13835 [Paracoccus denitrificans]|nr:MAG: hypothetical protein DI498_13835 [Paracoccus denitrificans]PZO82887.1 MAG: hypothetical protein DI633_13835 [Paracoccus denitrificans]